MTIQDKIDTLKIYISKMNQNTQEDKDELNAIIVNADILFSQDNISRLDIDLQEEAYDKWNKILDSALMLFPEYNTQFDHIGGKKLN